MESINSLTHG
ncbi:unnamed protein product, partial [Rotaria sp. Silwood2]